MAGILRDPGRVGTGCGAVHTGEIGLRNHFHYPRDQTAKNLHDAMDRAGLPLSCYLPMNAIPWYDGIANLATLRAGADHNASLLRHHNVRRIILFGAEAHRSWRYLRPRLPDHVTVTRLPHPSARGISAFRKKIGAANYAEALDAFHRQFAIAAVSPPHTLTDV